MQEKTIKPSELPTLSDEMINFVSEIDKMNKICNGDTLLTRFLYALVGVRVNKEVCGLYLLANDGFNLLSL